MLSYRHAYHAGNFADILKHSVLIEMLNYFIKKDKPFEYIDTHAGAGLYDLSSTFAVKNSEFQNGIEKLNLNEFPELTEYFSVIRHFNTDHTLG
ncbi:MAG: 23S rRNA (adenine(2030)-N(6))-methyltransferase RlmJ, partial [Gammaproteobacteria bacterium]|nr:23S rRNA (adenine(2030)-N(6))-methyltransferase RlmJ [Gammaproteobacteria bacterium]